MHLTIIFLLVACFYSTSFGKERKDRNKRKLEEVFEWKEIGYEGLVATDDGDFLFPGQEPHHFGSPNYIPANNVPFGLTHHKGYLYITVPRRKVGVPSTLNRISLDSVSTNKRPLLTPFPDFETNRLHPNLQADPTKIISILRPRIDECERLWFIDTGNVALPTGPVQLQAPSVWYIDLNSGERHRHRFEIPSKIVTHGEGMPGITIDVDPNDCGNAFAYIPDLIHGQLYVYSLAKNQMWAFAHNYFRMDPFQGDLDIAGIQFQWKDSLFSLALGPRQSNGYRQVYFHPMISTNEFVVSSEVLQNEHNSKRLWQGDDFKLLGNRGAGRQSASHHYDPTTGIVFYAFISQNSVGCWNSEKPYNEENHAVLHKDDENMIYPCDLKTDSNDTLWVMSNELPVVLYSTLDPNDYKFRVWKANTREIVKGTVCQSPNQEEFDN